MIPKILLEVLGYLGMVIVLISFFFSNIKRLRIVNMAGGILCLIYGILTQTWPTALLNASLVTINGVYLVRTLIKEANERAMAKSENENTENKKEENI